VRLSLVAEEGEVASSHPYEIFKALVELAVADGADADAFVDSILRKAGATTQEITVGDRAQFEVIRAAVEEADKLYEMAMTLARSEIAELIRDAVKAADREHYRKQIGG